MTLHKVYQRIYSNWLLLCYISQFLRSVNSAIIDVETNSEGSCASLKSSISEDVLCKLNGKIVTCNDPKENTTAIVRCKDYHVPRGSSPFYQCQNGSWDREFLHCIPECGIKNLGILYNTTIAQYEYPWVVAIYNATNNLICSGTIISKYLILSAAHCFTNEYGKPRNKQGYTIAAGKNYRDISMKETSAQMRKIKEFFIHENYGGDIKNFRDDIALVKLREELIISKEVRPICIDWNNTFEDFDFLDGNNGIVTGWGYTESGTTQSNTLKVIIVPYRSPNICLQHLPLDFGQEYFGLDKICAGYKNENRNVCQGDSGGGLYFLSDNKRYYIRGIASITVYVEGTCNSNQYTLYTKVSTYLPWIKSIIKTIT